MELLNVDIRKNCEVTVDTVSDFGADVIVCASGSTPGRIEITGDIPVYNICSCALQCLYFCYWFGMKAAIICVLLYLAEFWASIRLKRHTVQEFLLGSVVVVIIFILLILIF